jgi:hypothetical protein
MYVYGVVRAGQISAPLPSGVGESQVELLERAPLAALVSQVPGSSVPGRAKNLTAHTDVLRAAMDSGTVLPMRFGVLMPDAATVTHELLEAWEPGLVGMLDALDGRVEMTVSAMYLEDVLLREVVTEERTIAALRERVRRKPEAATYFERIRLGELVANAVEVRRQADAGEILEALRPFAGAYLPGDPLHERMVVNSAFLVERDKLSEFEQAVERVSAERAERMQFKLTGPLPPFSFVGTEELGWA